MAIELSASVKYGSNGKAFIARVVGRDPKWGTKLEFLGARRDMSRSGRTGQVIATVDDSGLYCEADSDGSRQYVVLGRLDGELVRAQVNEDTALEIARALDEGRSVDDLELRSTDKGPSVRRPPVDGKRGPIAWRTADDARAQTIATIRALMAEHAITVADLA